VGPTVGAPARAGLDVALDDGRRVRVPSGRVRVEGEASSVDRMRVVSHVHDLSRAPDDPADEGFDPFPYDRADEVVLRPGDRVELSAETDSVPDPDAPPAGYREGVRQILVARTPVVLRKLA
jgi:hypothetical protein